MFNILKYKNKINYRVIDNFLLANDFQNLTEKILADDFPWYFRNTKVGNQWKSLNSKSDNCLLSKFDYQFVHPFATNDIIRSNHINMLDPIFNKLGLIKKLRIKANLTPRTHKLIQYDFHRDTDEACYTSVFYINENDGYTIFSNGEKVKSIPNRILIFNSKELHAGSSCSNAKARIVINFNFISKFKFNI